MTGAEKLLRAAFPTRKAQEQFLREFEKATGVRIFRRRGQWEMNFGRLPTRKPKPA